MGTSISPKPNKLLDMLLQKYSVKNDAALCRELATSPAVLSKVRKNNAVGPELILRIHERFGVPVKTIRAALAD